LGTKLFRNISATKRLIWVMRIRDFAARLKQWSEPLRNRFQRALLCSDCFRDRGLRIEAAKIGKSSRARCPNCDSRTGVKLNESAIIDLARTFFIYGSFIKTEFGGTSPLRFGNGDVKFPDWLEPDVRLLKEKYEISLRHYGPPTWRIGEVEPLELLRNATTRQAAAKNVVQRFPRRTFEVGETFYRLRKGIQTGQEFEPAQYDAPPADSPSGRLNSKNLPVLYGSQNLEICIHECRVTKADVCHLATLKTTKPLELLDLCADIIEEGRTPFESLYLAIRFIFSAEEHSYEIAQAIAIAARDAGLHGVAYPSYYSTLTGGEIPNLGLFGRPVADRSVELFCANRLILNSARYEVTLGPVFD
jgi:hypothetical protein